MAKSETLWRCSTCDKLHGSESDALKCEEKHAFMTEIESIEENPTFVLSQPNRGDIVIKENISGEDYQCDVKNPKTLDEINIVVINTYSEVTRQVTYRRIGTEMLKKYELFDIDQYRPIRISKGA